MYYFKNVISYQTVQISNEFIHTKNESIHILFNYFELVHFKVIPFQKT